MLFRILTKARKYAKIAFMIYHLMNIAPLAFPQDCIPLDNTVRVRFHVERGDNTYDIIALETNTLTQELDLDSMIHDDAEGPRLVYILHSRTLSTAKLKTILGRRSNLDFVKDSCGK